MNYNKPILVTGSPRSGSTWIGNMLSTCKSLAYIHEPFNPYSSVHCPGRCSAKFSYWHTYINEENESDFYPPIQDIFNFRYHLFEQLRANQNLKDLRRTIKEYLLFQNYKYSRSIVPLIKDPMAVFSAEWLYQKFDLKVVVIVRHPAAVVSSFKRLEWQYDFSQILNQSLLMKDYLHPFKDEILAYVQTQKSLVDQGALLWKLIYYVISEFQKKYKDWIIVRHEDIAQSPESSFSWLFEKLDLEFSEEIKKTIASYSNSLNPLEGSPDNWGLIKLNSQESVSNWKKRLTQDEIAQIKNQVKEVSNLFYAENEWE